MYTYNLYVQLSVNKICFSESSENLFNQYFVRYLLIIKVTILLTFFSFDLIHVLIDRIGILLSLYPDHFAF